MVSDSGLERLSVMNEELAALTGRRRAREKLSNDLRQLKCTLDYERGRLRTLQSEVAKEQADVEKLEGLSLTGMFYTVLGSKEAQHKKERQEFLEATLKFDHCRDVVSKLEDEILDLQEKLEALGSPQSETEALLERKKALLVSIHHPAGVRLSDIGEQLGELQVDRREIAEALAAGEAALHELQQVGSDLDSARNWGMWDMLGGGLISTAIKHSRIDNARQRAQQAQLALHRFGRELKDIGERANITIEIGSFATFGDYFFDGLIFDWVVQSRITQSRDQVARTIQQLQQHLQFLRRQRDGVAEQMAALDQERCDILAGA